MYFDDSHDKGRCADGGGHQPAGLVFVLPHSGPETGNAQHNWRFCGKCHGMFFDGSPQKGACPAGGGHQAIGLNFVLPHDVAETPKSQRNWRFCGKCNSLFYDGSPNKGKCAKGGGHTAVGLNFVLPHQGDPFANALATMWDRVGRGIVSEKIKQTINGREFRSGWRGRDANVNLAELKSSWRRTSPTSMSIELRLPGSNAEFHTTQPSVLGSFADPAFRVGFDMLLRLDCAARATSPFISVNVTAASVSNASVHGSNAAGTIVETVADFFGHGEFTRQVTRQINDDRDLKSRMQKAINDALARVPNFVLPG
ncbi:MAG TPA: hypothetical protein VH913_25700 [Hyphomicrobiaceae bacterium]|jgi:hypothetical protein